MGRSKIAPSWMKDALRRIKGMMSKEKGPKLSKAERKALRSRSMPFIDPTADKVPTELAYAAVPVPGMETANSNELISRLKASKRQQSSPALPLTKSPRNGKKKSSTRLRPGIRREGELAGPAGVKSRNSAPVLSISHGRSKSPAERAPPAELLRAKSQPIIGAFVPKNVNQLKAVPFSLSEKMSRWCKRSPMALIKTHLEPEDPIDGEHPAIYDDVMCDAHGRNIDTLAIDARDARDGVTAKPRDECVLEMYAPGRHGITNHCDNAPAPAVAPAKAAKAAEAAEAAVVSPVPALRTTPVPKSRAPPTYDADTFQQQSSGGNSRPRFINLSASEKVGAETKKVTRAGGPKPLPPKRMPTNISIIPQRTMSNLNEGMLAQLTTVQ